MGTHLGVYIALSFLLFVCVRPGVCACVLRHCIASQFFTTELHLHPHISIIKTHTLGLIKDYKVGLLCDGL